MEKKIGVYICSGCGIGQSFDLEALSAVAGEYERGGLRHGPFSVRSRRPRAHKS